MSDSSSDDDIAIYDMISYDIISYDEMCRYVITMMNTDFPLYDLGWSYTIAYSCF